MSHDDALWQAEMHWADGLRPVTVRAWLRWLGAPTSRHPSREGRRA